VRALLVVAGTLCVLLGIIGAFVPVLPTTPFLLLAAACYARSSPRFYRWLTQNRFLGAYIRNYREGRGMTALSKCVTLGILWGGIVASILTVEGLVVHIFLGLVVFAVTTHILLLPTHRHR